MPTLELTDEQAMELLDVLVYESDRLTVANKNADPSDDDAIATAHTISVLSDIISLLEIA
jgi:hypothetical protein